MPVSGTVGETVLQDDAGGIRQGGTNKRKPRKYCLLYLLC